jgi:hypothetical protein
MKRLLELRVESHVFTTVNFVGAIASVLAFIAFLFGLNDSPGWAVVAVIYLCVVTTGSLLLVFVSDRRARRRGAYASALEFVHQAHHRLRDAEAGILQRDLGVQETLPDLRDVLTATAEAFTVITGERVRACIKEVHFPNDVAVPVRNAETVRELRISTMQRDQATGPKAWDSTNFFVDQNTAFEILFLESERFRWFWSNDLEQYASRQVYKNTSWQEGRKDYLACCVWPIQKQDESNEACHDVLGFLCVDSMATNVFHDHFDFHLGAGIADAMYPLLKLMHQRADEPALEAADGSKPGVGATNSGDPAAPEVTPGADPT